MRTLRKVVLAGAAAIALAGIAGWAAAEIRNVHVLEVRLPDGGSAHIRYLGDTPPTISVASAPLGLSIVSPASDVFEPESQFAALEQMSEAMDRQAEAMLRQVSAPPALALAGPDLTPVDLGKLPPGVEGFSVVTTASGDGVCTRSIQYRSLGDGRPPKVVTRTSGACAADQAQPSASGTSGATPPAPRPKLAGRKAI